MLARSISSEVFFLFRNVYLGTAPSRGHQSRAGLYVVVAERRSPVVIYHWEPSSATESMGLILTVRLANGGFGAESRGMLSVIRVVKGVESSVVRLVKAATFGTLPRVVTGVERWVGRW